MQKKAQPFTFQTTFEPKAYFRLVFKQKRAVRARFIQICDLLHCHNTIIIGFKANHFARNQFTRQDLLRQWVFDLLLNSTF
ncbi:Uncharacterised protein [Salmonella enterica subsp. enterica]|uniref:Uncharacterized protein n=1 Tax=Salmonella enterica I TaxID=59201 RepID=A0A379UUM2_SALET|nr:Uncharacterised protein [Salmonella enterica subsp. enterica]